MEFVGNPGDETVESSDGFEALSEVLVQVLSADVGELSLSDLDDRLAELGRARSKLEGLLAEALAERARRSSCRAATAVLRERVLEAAGRASRDVRLAVSLSENFPDTLKALSGGEINSGHARVIDRLAGKPDHLCEEVLLKEAKSWPADLLSRVALCCERAGPDTYTKYQQQHQDRKAFITQEPDGSWKLFAHLDYMAGRRASLALAKMAEVFRREENSYSQVTYLQRNADAVVQLFTGDGPQRVGPTSLLVIADYNAKTDTVGAPRLDDGQPVPFEQITELVADADIYPAIFNNGEPLWLGRAQRSASFAQRIVLAARDHGCIGCNTPPERCEAHHITHWANQGSTDIDNLTLLCPGCHHLVHDCGWQITQQPPGNYRINAPPH